jgi:hypothetical protein
MLKACLAAEDRLTDHNAHGWYMYFGDHPLGQSKWGVHLEGQWRRHDVISKWQQLLLRPGVNYTVNNNLMLTGGYAYIRSYPYGSYPTSRAATPEHRLWQQALIRYRAGKASWSTRLRFENRFLGVLNAQTNDVDRFRFENRFRAWERVAIALSREFYIAAYDEFWTYVPPYESRSWFDQNRAYAAVGRKFGPYWDLELGYMNQLILQRNGRVLESNHTLMISVVSRRSFARK